MENKIYVVLYGEGAYEDYCEYVISAFPSEEEAKKCVDYMKDHTTDCCWFYSETILKQDFNPKDETFTTCKYNGRHWYDEIQKETMEYHIDKKIEELTEKELGEVIFKIVDESYDEEDYEEYLSKEDIYEDLSKDYFPFLYEKPSYFEEMINKYWDEFNCLLDDKTKELLLK